MAKKPIFDTRSFAVLSSRKRGTSTSVREGEESAEDWLNRICSGPSPALLETARAQLPPKSAMRLVGAGSDCRASRLEAISNKTRTEGWVPGRGRPVVPMVAPVDWGQSAVKDANLSARLNCLRPIVPWVFLAYDYGDGEKLDWALELAFDWTDYNVVHERENARKWTDMPAGFRAHYLSALLHAVLLCPAGTRDHCVEPLVRSLVLHAEKLCEPVCATRTNHVLYVALGLASIAHVLPWAPAATIWRRQADEYIDRYLEHNITADGILKEHSPAYHASAIRGLRALRSSGRFGAPLDGGITSLAATVVWLCHPNGEYALVGDSEGQADTGLDPCLDYALTSGREGEKPPDAPVCFRQSGLAVMRDPWTVMPSSSHSYVYLSAAYFGLRHKHSDDLTYEWSNRGAPVILDSGKYIYDETPWRDFFRATRASNTIELDGKDYERHGKEVGRSRVVAALKTPSGIQGLFAHAEHRSWPATQHRGVIMRPGAWLLVLDRVRAQKSTTATQWHGLHERFEADGDNAFVCRESGEKLWTLDLTGKAAFARVRGARQPREQGWISHAYQTKVPRWSLGWTQQGSDLWFATLFAFSRPIRGGFEPAERDEGSCRVSIRTEECVERLAVNFEANEPRLVETPR